MARIDGFWLFDSSGNNLRPLGHLFSSSLRRSDNYNATKFLINRTNKVSHSLRYKNRKSVLPSIDKCSIIQQISAAMLFLLFIAKSTCTRNITSEKDRKNVRAVTGPTRTQLSQLNSNVPNLSRCSLIVQFGLEECSLAAACSPAMKRRFVALPCCQQHLQGTFQDC